MSDDAQIETATPDAVLVWQHTRKGQIIGVPHAVVGDWTDIALVGDHDLTYTSGLYRRLQADGAIDRDGQVQRFRTEFLSAPVPYDPEVHG